MVFKLNFVLNDEHNLFKSDVIYSISEVKCNLFERDIYVRLMKLWIFKHMYPLYHRVIGFRAIIDFPI
jgi:hypothetical protein